MNELILFSKKSELAKSDSSPQDDQVVDLKTKKSSTDEKSGFPANFFKLIEKYDYILISLILATLAGFLYGIIGFRSLYETLPFFRLRWFLLGFLITYLLVSFIASFKPKYTAKESIQLWLNSFLILLVSFLYYARISFNTIIPVLGIDISSRMIYIPLIIFIFAINFNLFGKQRNSLLFIVPQIFLITVQSFSFISTINTDVTFERDFSVGWLEWIFNIPIIWWLIISSTFVSFVSISSLKLKVFKESLIYYIIFFILTVQAILGIYILQLTYWYQALLFLIIWDFLFIPTSIISLRKSDLKFIPKLIISSIYHLVLFAIIIVFLNIFGV